MIQSGIRLLCTLLTGALLSRAGQPVTFNHDIAPLVFKNCAPCHRPGEAGPFSLLTYQDVKSHARQIAAVTRSRFMPPWQPEEGQLKFAEERRLTNEEIELLQKWVAAGTPEGNHADAPRAPQFTRGWQLGKPDLILQAQKPFTLPADGSDIYWNFVLPVPVSGTRWMKAIEIRPGDKRIVHHANITVDRLGSARELEQTPGAGFGGMDVRIASDTFDPDSHLLFWKPGTAAAPEPDGMALRIDKGTDLVLNMHMQPSGRPELVQPSIGLYFTDQPATQKPMLIEMENDAALTIPAGDSHFVVSDSFVLPVDADLLAIYPHAHYIGKDLQASATLPDGAVKTLIHIKHWDLNWQAVYRYAEPVSLPKGTTVNMRYLYDNSDANSANPNHPAQIVRGGNRSRDEMAHLWLQLLPHDGSNQNFDPRIVLQEAFSRHEVDKDPGNFEAEFNLASVLRMRGETAPAMEHYNAAWRTRPYDPVINNAWGSALLTGGNLEQAIEHLNTAVRVRPTYFDARYNLGIALASSNQFDAAVEQFRAAVRLNPTDATAHANLGAALGQTGRLADATSEVQTALKLDPANKLAQENLAQLKEMSAQPPHAN